MFAQLAPSYRAYEGKVSPEHTGNDDPVRHYLLEMRIGLQRLDYLIDRVRRLEIEMEASAELT